MSRGRYYFPEIIGNNALKIVAQLSQQTLREGEKIVEIFRRNYNLLYEKSPEQHSLLMKQNSQSIFDLSPNNLALNKQKESCFRIRKSSEGMSTPFKRNTTLHRKCLSIDDTMEEASDCTVSETETDIVHQKIFSPKNGNQSNIDPMVDVPDIAAEVFVRSSSPINPECTDNSTAENIKYLFPSSADREIVTVDQKFVSPNTSKMEDNPEASNQESPRSAQTTKMLAKLNVDGSESTTPPKLNTMPDMLLINLENSNNHEKIAANSNNHKEIAEISDNHEQITENSDNHDKIAKTYGNHEQTVENSDNHEQIAESSDKSCTARQDSNVLEESLKIPNSTTEEKHTPSPIKLAKVASNNDSKSELQAFSYTDNEVRISSHLDTKMTDVSFTRNNKNISPIGISKTLAIPEEKRKSPSPRRNKLLFRAIPKIISSNDSDELDIEFSCESEESPSPTTSRFSSRIVKTTNVMRGNNTAKERIGCDVLNESKVKISPKTLQSRFSPSGNKTYASSSENITETSSPTEGKCYVTRKTISPSTKPLTERSPNAENPQFSPSEKKHYISSYTIYAQSDALETGEDYSPRNSISPSAKISPKLPKFKFSPSGQNSSLNTLDDVKENNDPSEIKGCFLRQISPSDSCLKTKISTEDRCDTDDVSKKNYNSDYNILHLLMNKLAKLVSLRDECMSKIFESFSEFQKDLNLLFLYIKRIAYVLEKIPTEGQVYVTEEFKKVTVDLTADAHKLEERIDLWKASGDIEVQSWIQCFEEIRIIKSRSETCKDTEASPVEHMSFLRAYEKDLKSVWKKMDDMKISEDARRSLLVNSAHDFELLIKRFLKCLINIGALKLRKKSSSNKEL